MAVDKVGTQTTAYTQNTKNEKAETSKPENKPAETNNKKDEETPASVYTKSNEPYDKAAIEKLLKESKDQTFMFEQLVSSVLNKQGFTFTKSVWNTAVANGNLSELFSNLAVDKATQDKAKELVSEDGYYGVKQTSERLLSFAKAYAGSDPARVEEMRKAFEKGFKAAENAWGGKDKKLPAICYETYDAVMKGFDDMLPAVASAAE